MHLHQPEMFNGSEVLHIFYLLNVNGVWGRSSKSPEAIDDIGVSLQNNAFLVMFQLKFCHKTFETSSLLRIYLNVAFLAVLFKY